MIGQNKMTNNKHTTLAGLFASWAGTIALLCTGCSMCSGPYDYDYPNFGGAVQRSNANWGRVGSVFSDPGPFGGPSADSNLKPHESGYNLGSDEFEAVPEPSNPPELQMQSPNSNQLNGSGNRNGDTDVLPAPQPQSRPSPDETRRSIIPRLRSQSRRNFSTWR